MTEKLMIIFDHFINAVIDCNLKIKKIFCFDQKLRTTTKFFIKFFELF